MSHRKPDANEAQTYRGFYADILHYLRKRTDNASDAADMTQDVFTQWLGYRDQAKVEQPRAFLFQMARNLLRDHWRRQKVRQTLFVEQLPDSSEVELQVNSTQSNEPLARAQQQQHVQRLSAVMAELSPRRREALMLHRFDGMSQAQIAEHMGISISMVEKHIASALLHCKRRLEQDANEEPQP